MSVYFITGASRGFGAEIVDKALAKGHQVVATARDTESIEDRFGRRADLVAVDLDVIDAEQVEDAVRVGLSRFGRIDVVINNAGRGLLAAVEEASDGAARAVFDVNVFGVLNVLRAVLPTLRRQHSGRILNISSIGGFVGGPGWGIYCSTKFAVEGLSEALAAELAPLGVSVTIVEPGYFRTDFLDTSSLHTESSIIADYAQTAGAVRERAADLNHTQPGDPARAAAAIVAIADSDDPPLRVQLGTDSFTAVTDKLGSVAEEQKRWRDLAVSTDYPPSA